MSVQPVNQLLRAGFAAFVLQSLDQRHKRLSRAALFDASGA